MKNLKKEMFLKTLVALTLSFFFIFTLFYLLIKNLIFETAAKANANDVEVIREFNLLWLEMGGLFLLLFALTAYVLNSIGGKIREDVNEVANYLEEISSKKNYDAIIKIQHYVEFLKIALILKNVVKRLNQKSLKK